MNHDDRRLARQGRRHVNRNPVTTHVPTDAEIAEADAWTALLHDQRNPALIAAHVAATEALRIERSA
jgi:hypothetical protein